MQFSNWQVHIEGTRGQQLPGRVKGSVNIESSGQEGTGTSGQVTLLQLACTEEEMEDAKQVKI